MDTPTALQFRLSEASEILSDLKDLLKRIYKHRDYLADPNLHQAHIADCENNDAVVGNLMLAFGDLISAINWMQQVLELTPKPETEPSPQ